MTFIRLWTQMQVGILKDRLMRNMTQGIGGCRFRKGVRTMAEIVVWQDGRPKCRYIGCVPTPEEQRALRRGGCEIRVDGKAVSRIIRKEDLHE